MFKAKFTPVKEILHSLYPYIRDKFYVSRTLSSLNIKQYYAYKLTKTK